LSGYTAKVAGTEVGVTEREVTFSACFGAPFLVWHRTVYARLLADKLKRHQTQVWLVNTGWTGGGYGVGSRMKLSYTRAIVDAINSGELNSAPVERDEHFDLAQVIKCPGVPDEILQPAKAWSDPNAYRETAAKLAALFRKNFEKFEQQAAPEVLAAGPLG